MLKKRIIIGIDSGTLVMGYGKNVQSMLKLGRAQGVAMGNSTDVRNFYYIFVV